jgi:hypothetical protein
MIRRANKTGGKEISEKAKKEKRVRGIMQAKAVI